LIDKETGYSLLKKEYYNNHNYSFGTVTQGSILRSFV
jgi:hypothetical protein